MRSPYVGCVQNYDFSRPSPSLPILIPKSDALSLILASFTDLTVILSSQKD